jgi:hypothetical protein
MAPRELSVRKPVWYQLSRLYLDTELDDGDLQGMAADLARSPYSVAELREIELWEVAPVVHLNLRSVAGEWAGFDEGWIHGECEKRAKRRGLLLRLAMPLGFRRFVRSATGGYWSRLGPMIEATRGDGSPG